MKTLLHPIIPFSTALLHEDLAQTGTVLEGGWHYSPIAPGTALHPVRPLYAKIDVAPGEAVRT